MPQFLKRNRQRVPIKFRITRETHNNPERNKNSLPLPVDDVIQLESDEDKEEDIGRNDGLELKKE